MNFTHDVTTFMENAKMADSMNPTWAIVELMGHVRMGGKVSEEERFGSKMGRIDIPRGDGFYTQYFGGQSVYRITFVEEAAARGVANGMISEPVHTWEFPKSLAIGTSQKSHELRFSENDL